MTLPSRRHASTLLSAWLIGLAALSAARPASASSTYPPEVQKALSKQFNKAYCVPQCIVCHLTNTGGIGTLNSFGTSLKADTGLFVANPGAVGPAFEKYFADKPNADSDGDGLSDLNELEQGDSPAIKLPRGEGLICPDAAYGCGARVAPAPPPPIDRLGLFSAGLAVLGLALLRRRQRRP